MDDDQALESAVRDLADAVDALVEVRHVKGTVCQRWRFPGATGTTDWVET